MMAGAITTGKKMMTLNSVPANTLEWSIATKMIPMAHWARKVAMKKTSVWRRLVQNKGP